MSTKIRAFVLLNIFLKVSVRYHASSVFFNCSRNLYPRESRRYSGLYKKFTKAKYAQFTYYNRYTYIPADLILTRCFIHLGKKENNTTQRKRMSSKRTHLMENLSATKHCRGKNNGRPFIYKNLGNTPHAWRRNEKKQMHSNALGNQQKQNIYLVNTWTLPHSMINLATEAKKSECTTMQWDDSL